MDFPLHSKYATNRTGSSREKDVFVFTVKKGRTQMGSFTWKGLIAPMPHIELGSNRTGSSAKCFLWNVNGQMYLRTDGRNAGHRDRLYEVISERLKINTVLEPQNQGGSLHSSIPLPLLEFHNPRGAFHVENMKDGTKTSQKVVEYGRKTEFNRLPVGSPVWTMKPLMLRRNLQPL